MKVLGSPLALVPFRFRRISCIVSIKSSSDGVAECDHGLLSTLHLMSARQGDATGGVAEWRREGGRGGTTVAVGGEGGLVGRLLHGVLEHCWALLGVAGAVLGSYVPSRANSMRLWTITIRVSDR